MRKLLYFLLLISSAAEAQGPGTFSSPFNIPSPYGTPGNVTQQISTFKPYDSSASYLHPCIILAGGAGEVNNTNITSSTFGAYAKNNGATMRVANHGNDSATLPFVTYYLIWLYKGTTGSDGDGNFNYKYYKNAWKYVTTTLAGKVDPKKIYFQGLSLSGGAAADLIRDSIIWCQRFAAGALCDAVIGNFYVDNQTDITNNMNTAGLHVRFYWGSNDTQSNSPTFRDKMEFYYGGTSGNTTRPDMWINSGGTHGSGWTMADDTGHVSFTAVSPYTTSPHNPNLLEWFTRYTSNYTPTNQPPVSNAGSPQTITLPTNSVTLNGSASYDPDGRPLTGYLWTKVSGPASQTIGSPTSVSTSITNLVQGTYVYNLQVTDDSSATANSTVSVTVNPAPVANPYYPATVYDVFDFSGYFQSEATNGWFFFDSQKGRGPKVADPVNGVITDTTSTNNPAHGYLSTLGAPTHQFGNTGWGQNNFGITYPESNRSPWFVVDLAGLSDATDTTKQFKITSISWTDEEGSGETCDVYKLDSGLAARSMTNRFLPFLKPDSAGVLRKIATLSDSAFSHKWRTTAVDSSINARYLVFVIRGTPDQHIFQSGEIVINGRYLYDTVAQRNNIRPQRYTGALPSQKNANYTYNKKIGTNLFQGIGLNSLKYDGPLRWFVGAGYMDTATAAGVPAKYRFYYSPSFTADLNSTYLASAKAAGHFLLFTNQGGSAYNFTNGYGAIYLDSAGKHPAQPSQYLRAGDWAYQVALKFGAGKRTTTAVSKWLDDAGYPNDMGLFNGNENDNEAWAHGVTYPALFWKNSIQYDGHQNTIGTTNQTGFKYADSTWRAVLGGMVDPDTNQVKSMWFMAQWLRTDKKVPFDDISFHKYFSNKDSANGNTFSYATQIGMHTEMPEWVYGVGNNALTYLNDFARNIYKYVDTSHHLYWTENGQGNTAAPSTTQSEAAAGVSPYQTFTFGSYDSAQSKAIERQRTELFAAASTAVHQFYDYALTNQFGDTVNYRAPIFQSFGKSGRSAVTAPFDLQWFTPTWYYNAAFTNNLGNYYFDHWDLQGGRSGRWQQYWVNASNPDSIAIVTWYGSQSGQSASNTLTVPSTITSMRRVTPSFTTTGTTTTVTPSSGSIASQTINESPVMYFGSLSGGGASAPSCTTNSTPANSATGVSITATLTWNAAAGATSYDVYVYTGTTIPGSPTANVSGTTYTTSALSYATSYKWFVVPKNTTGSATGCSTNLTTFTTQVAPPGCTTNLTTTSINNTSATLNWNTASGATSYKVYLFLNGGSAPGSPSYTTSGTSQAVSGLSAGMVYKFYVVPSNSTGDGSNCSVNYSTFTTTNTTLPAGCPCSQLLIKRY